MNQVFLVLLSIFSFVGYVFTNRRPYAFVFKTKFDDKIPLVPVFVLPYVLLFPYLLFTYFVMSKTTLLVEFLIAVILVNLLASTFWYFFPNGVKRNKLNAKRIFEFILNYIYKHDGDTNGFPSGHVFLALTCSYYLILATPSYFLLWAILAIIISISTVFTKQHYVVDILGGVFFAFLAVALSVTFI